MRRFSALLGLAAVILSAIVGYTYSRRIKSGTGSPPVRPEVLRPDIEAKGSGGWVYRRSNAVTHQPEVRAEARAYSRIKEPSTSLVEDLKLRLFNKQGSSYTYVKSSKALFDEQTGVMTSEGDVAIIMNVPAEKEPDDNEATAKLIRVQGSGVRYDTKTGQATTDKAAKFQFADGNGEAVGLEYDPAKRELHLKSQVSLNWVGNAAPDKVMHIEAGDLLYKELDQTVYLSPWSRMKRGTTTIEAKDSLVALQDGRLHQVDSAFGKGEEVQDERHITFSADKLISFFNDDGAITSIVGENSARIVAADPAAKTTVTSQRGELHFLVETKQAKDKVSSDSVLQSVQADGGAVVESVPQPRPNVLPAETRILRSEHLWMDMKPGGQEIKDIQTSAKARLEFKPNRPSQSYRTLNADRIFISYGEENSIDNFHAWKASTRTDRPQQTPAVAKAVIDAKESASKQPDSKDPKKAGPQPPAYTWSDELVAKFAPKTSQLTTIDQTGSFRYQEGDRQARAGRAHMDQTSNQITLTEAARIWDGSGSTAADSIFMNQASGDMDATGHVASTRQPDNSAQNSGTLLDDSKPMQAKGDKMVARDSNLKIRYEGHAVVWQGANRTAASQIDIDRDAGTFRATGNVVSELQDQKKQASDSSTQPDLSKDNKKTATAEGKLASASSSGSDKMIYTVVRAPELLYDDGEKVAHYTGGVRLVRDAMTVTSQELRAFFKQDQSKKDDDSSSLDHVFADGNVVVTEVNPTRTRTGTAPHAEFYADDSKLILNGGGAQMVDSGKGTTRGQELTYFNGDDRLLVKGEKNALVVTHMKKK
jgi:lipopolysaccharide export system protein LptA